MATSNNKSLTLIALSTAAILGLSLAFYGVPTSTKGKQRRNDSCSHNQEQTTPPHAEIPPHVQREIYKEWRRKESVRFLALKKPMYDNIEMYDPEGVMLCTIGKKKANWYVEKKQLAVWRTPLPDDENGGERNTSNPPSIQLLFTPKNGKTQRENDAEIDGTPSNKSRVYNTSHKRNICVACGSPTGLMRHYVVPYSYRHLLPTKFKSHLPHDIVLLCMDCHVCADHAGLERRNETYERRYRTDPDSTQPVIPNLRARHVKSCAQALLKHREKLPPQRIEEYEMTVWGYFHSVEPPARNESAATAPTSGDVHAYSQSRLEHFIETIETETPNPKYIPIQALVVNALKTDQDVADFIRSWRELFLETLHPRYLPKGWSVDSPVESDSY
jgi:hypothetical protein